MRISSVVVTLTEQDLLRMIREYVHVEGLTIEKLEVKELIYISGSYKKGVSVPFKAKVGLGSVVDNMLKVKILGITVYHFDVLKKVQKFALKTFLKAFKEMGITVEDDLLTVNLTVLSRFIPYVYFRLQKVTVLKGILEMEVSDLIYAQDKEIASTEKKMKELEAPKAQVRDNYTKIRQNIESKVSEKYKPMLQYAMLIPDIVALFCRLFRDRRVDVKVKLLIGGLLGYLAAPVDILPDVIPFIGKIDDIAITFFALEKIMNQIPEQVILENWQGSENIILTIKEGVAYLSTMTGSQNVAKVASFIQKLTSLKNDAV